MFYGIPQDKREAFSRALSSIMEIYPKQVYAQDMLICVWKNLAFRSDKNFMDSFTSVAKTDQEKSLLWRLHVLAWASHIALRMEGDFVECGVFKGFSSAVLCKYHGFGNVPREFYLYDTFSGLPEETSTDDERGAWNPSYKAVDSKDWYKEVCQTFSPYPNVRVIRGVVPHTFEAESPERIAYLHIDMNSEKAEILALESLFDRVVPGGVVVLDDYGWQCNARQTVAESAFMKKRDHMVLELPTGQGVILKHDYN